MQKLYKYLGAALFTMAGAFSGQAQQPAPVNGGTNKSTLEACGASLVHENLLRTNEHYRKQVQANQAKLQAVKAGNAQSRVAQTSSGILTIPVVVHVVHTGEAIGVGNNISDAQIQSAITALNDMYRRKPGTNGYGGGVDMEVEFQLATKDPNCNPTTGIVRVNGSSVANYATSGVKASSVGADEVAVKNLSRWPASDYYNIWVVNEIENNNGGAGIQGYAYFPGAPATIDGTIILNSAFGTTGTVKSYTNRGQTLAHEMGHAFNLYHTFEGDGDGTLCPPVVNGCGSGQGDCIGDTEPHKRSNSTCPAGTFNTCTNATIGNVYKNYMDYSSQTCSNEFTAQQREWVRSAIENLRPGLVNSSALNASTLSVPVAAVCSPTGTVTSNNYGMGIYKVGINTSAVTSDGTVNENALLVNRVCSQQFEVSGESAFPVSVNTGSANNENVRMYLDFNNNGNFADAGELVFSSTNAKTHSGTVTPPANVLKNTALRLRVISDWAGNTISGPCYVPQYGQAEEYSLFFVSPLPVILVGFQAKKVEQEVKLSWKTAQEINNAYFEIERSANATSWTALGRISGKGTTSSEQEYTFMDTRPEEGTNYYRLKQVDTDGTFAYSPIEQVQFSKETAAVLVYPNPGKGLYTISFSEVPAGNVQLRVFNLNGGLLYNRSVKAAQQHDFSIEHRPAGLYILEVTNGSTVTRIKLVKE